MMRFEHRETHDVLKFLDDFFDVVHFVDRVDFRGCCTGQDVHHAEERVGIAFLRGLGAAETLPGVDVEILESVQACLEFG